MFEIEYLGEMHCLAGLVLALHALLAIWIGMARRPRWPVRFAILLGVIALWIPIECRDIIVYLLFQSGVIAGVLLVFRGSWPWLRRKLRRGKADEVAADLALLVDASHDRSNVQLTLKDLLIATALVAVVFALARSAAAYYPVNEWGQLPLPVAATSGIALAATLAVFSTGRWWWRSCPLLG